VQKPPSTSQTRTFLSAPAVASNPPDKWQAIPFTGLSWPYSIPKTNISHNPEKQVHATICKMLKSQLLILLISRKIRRKSLLKAK
jgi:hypothetical protein